MLLPDGQDFERIAPDCELPGEMIVDICLAKSISAVKTLLKETELGSEANTMGAIKIWKHFRRCYSEPSYENYVQYADFILSRSERHKDKPDAQAPQFDETRPKESLGTLAHLVAFKALLAAYKYGTESARVDKGILRTVLSKALDSKVELSGMVQQFDVNDAMTDEQVMEVIEGITGNGPRV